jgi:hypothetical protein
MPVQHINRKGQTYYLHQGVTKTGNPKYFFSTKYEGILAETIPDGFEIYENPNARVFLRRIRPKIITDNEIKAVKHGMQRFSELEYYQIDVRKNVIIVFTADQDVEVLSEILAETPAPKDIGAKNRLAQLVTYSPTLQFVLVDKEKRIFLTQRYCFFGSIDDWIQIGEPDTLPNLVKRYVRHLGQDSYYELY